MKNTNLIALVVALLVLAGGSIYFSSSLFGSGLAEALPEGNIVASSALSGVVVGADVIGTRSAPPPTHTEEYVNERYRFSYWHTPQATITEYDEGGGAMTIVHENEEKVRGMQIFIVPYAEEKISEERFRLDVPSGVRENVEATTLDGVEAVTFTSYDARLGETREIWFIKDGHLYEITTFKGVGQWFAPVIQSWRFFK